MSKFYMVTSLISGESEDFQGDVKKYIKEIKGSDISVRVFATEEEAKDYAKIKTPTNYYLGNPAVVTLEISDEVWHRIESVTKSVKSKDNFFPDPKNFSFKNVHVNQIGQFISAKGDANWHKRGEVFSLENLDVADDGCSLSCSVQ